MKAIRVIPGKYSEIVEIDAGLKSLQKEVGGYIEVIYPFASDVAIVCNDEAKLTGQRANRALYDDAGEIYDIICGTFLVLGCEYDDFRSLTEPEAEMFMSRFYYPEIMLYDLVNGKYISIKAKEVI